MVFSEILDKIPHWKSYYTVDELHQRSIDLAEEHPGKVKLIDLGQSTNGEAIDCIKIGDGKFHALIHGFPNSEEPYGGNLLDYLAQALAENDNITESLDYTWFMVKCSDPDAARLNQGFQIGPLTPINFCLNFYRTPVLITPEICFPFLFGPLDLNSPTPETRALMKIMDANRLHFVSSLHMMKWGGISYMVPFECPPLYAGLQNSAKRFDVFLRKRPGTMLAPGIMLAEYLTPARNWVRHWSKGVKNIEPIKGCNMYEYGQQLNPHMFMMIPECCLWYDPRMLDDRPSDTTLGEAFRYGDAKMKETDEYVLDAWRKALPHLKTETPFKFMMQDYMEPLIHKYTNVSNPPFSFNEKVYARKAIVAEKIGVEGHDDIYRMFYLGGLIRAFDAELERRDNGKLKSLRDQAYSTLCGYDEFLHENYEIVAHPIHNLVGMGIGSLLNSAIYAKTLQR